MQEGVLPGVKSDKLSIIKRLAEAEGKGMESQVLNELLGELVACKAKASEIIENEKAWAKNIGWRLSRSRLEKVSNDLGVVVESYNQDSEEENINNLSNLLFVVQGNIGELEKLKRETDEVIKASLKREGEVLPIAAKAFLAAVGAYLVFSNALLFSIFNTTAKILLHGVISPTVNYVIPVLANLSLGVLSTMAAVVPLLKTELMIICLSQYRSEVGSRITSLAKGITSFFAKEDNNLQNEKNLNEAGLVNAQNK